MYEKEFIERWYNKAIECEDCFDKFFSAWIALVIRARVELDDQDRSQPDVDRIAIIHYFENRSEDILDAFKDISENLKWLAERKGTGTALPILDVNPYSPQYLRQVFDELSLVWTGKKVHKPRWIANAVAEMINHVRNNLFHGAKDPDDAADKELLDRINLLLIRVLSI
jgi:hypothetical protein